MTLATRCPSCNTAFRVVQDQLKVANGWVRCGRCQHVFDAGSVLFVPDASAAGAGDGGDGERSASSDTVGSPGVPQSTAGAAAADVPVGADGPSIEEPSAIEPSPTALGDLRRPDEVAVDVPLTDIEAPAAPLVDGSAATVAPALTTVEAATVETPTPNAPTRGSAPSSEAAVDATAAATATALTPPSVPPQANAVVVDIGIGSVMPASPGQPAALLADADDDADADATPPDFVDARFNEDLLAGLPGLRDPADGDGVHAGHPAAGVPSADMGPGPTVAGMAPLASADAATDLRPAGPAAAQPIPADIPAPTFLRSTRRAGARRREQRRLRIALGAAALLLALGLAWQASVHWRELLAARWPATAPWLAAACAPAGCAVHPLRRIDDLSVDSTTLAPTAPDAPALRLAVVIVNRGELPVAAPSIDLSLTDTTGELVARKVLHPADFHAGGSVLKASTTVHWQAVLTVAERAPEHHVAGYTVELFYP